MRTRTQQLEHELSRERKSRAWERIGWALIVAVLILTHELPC